MRALLQERVYQLEKTTANNHSNSGKPLMTNVLYFGCRYKSVDFIYKEEIEELMARSGGKSKLLVAFSREPQLNGGDEKKKLYVQHVLQEEENAKGLLRLLFQEGGYIYVCGGTAMGNDVQRALVDILIKYGQEKGGMDEKRAMEELSKLQKAGRYVQELWSA